MLGLTVIHVFALLAATSSSCDLSLERARQQLMAQRYDLAVGAFQQAIVLCPQERHASLLLNLARAQLAAQHIADCLHSLDGLLGMERRNVAALKLRADALYLLGQEDEAERSLLTAIEIDPKDPELVYSLGRIFYQEHRYSEAVRRFSDALRLNPKSYKAHDNLGLCYEALNDDQQAIREYMKALDLVYKDHPEYDWPYGNLAGLMLKKGEYQKAFELAAEAAYRNPRSARNCYLTGKALVKLDKWELSLRWLKRAAELDPAYADPHYLLASVYKKEGRRDKAASELETFQRITATQPRERR